MALALQQPTEPTTDQQPTTVSATVDASQLAVALRGALKATTTEKQAVRGFEAVICLEPTEHDYLEVVATDGCRMHAHQVYMLAQPIDIHQPLGQSLPAQMLVPVAGARALLKVFRPSDKWVDLVYHSDNHTVSVNGGKPVALATDVKYVSWQAIGRPGKESLAGTVHLDPEARQVFTRWLKMAGKDHVLLSIEPDLLTLEIDWSKDSFLMLVESDNYLDQPFTVGFQANYLRLALEAFPAGPIELDINAKHGPATVHNDSAQYALVMPTKPVGR